MRSSTPADLKGHCAQCLLRREACVCGELPALRAPFDVAIYRHFKEVWRTSNSARLAALALPGARIHDYGGPGVPPPASPPLAGTWLLFPGGTDVPAGRPERLVVVDGSWAQARRMVQRVGWMRDLPRLSLRGPSVPSVRRSPQPGALPTVVAIAAAMEFLGSPEEGRALRKLHATWVERLHALRGGAGLRPSVR